MSDPVLDLQRACESVILDPSLKPIFDLDTGELAKSFCNIAVTRVCEEYGITAFRGLMANEICDYMDKHWKEINGRQANGLANDGVICIAGQKEAGHGHVALVYPGAMVWSAKWKYECPTLASVGKRNGVMGANWAFAKAPTYWTEP